CSNGSSKPSEKLDPPPGGLKTLELFLLLGPTPLKVVVVVMAPRGEVDWRRENAEGTGINQLRQSATKSSHALREPLPLI
ncbi:hypothetical protein HispidOSU_027281, partial [Sigmodon hispidus]